METNKNKTEVESSELLAEVNPELLSTKKLKIEVLYLENEDPFICGVEGGLTLSDMERLSEEVENYEGYREEGAYIFNTQYHPAEYAFGGWVGGDGYELTEIYFAPLTDDEETIPFSS